MRVGLWFAKQLLMGKTSLWSDKANIDQDLHHNKVYKK